MRKVFLAAATAALAAAMVTGVSADDVVVRTSVGSGEVVFTETDKAAELSAEELSALVKDAIASAKEQETLSLFLDAEAKVSIKFDEQNTMEMTGTAIGQAEKNADKNYANFTYAFDGFGNSMGGTMESYGWEADGHEYSAFNDGSGWKVEDICIVDKIYEIIDEVIDSKEAQGFNLSGLLPNLYEENGQQFYVFMYNKDSVMETANGFDGAELYTGLADSILGDNDLKLILVINAETYLPRAFTIDASDSEGSIPGELFGTEGSLGFSTGDLYVTYLMNEDASEIEIPDEVLETPVEENVVHKALDQIKGLLEGAAAESDAA